MYENLDGLEFTFGPFNFQQAAPHEGLGMAWNVGEGLGFRV